MSRSTSRNIVALNSLDSSSKHELTLSRSQTNIKRKIKVKQRRIRSAEQLSYEEKSTPPQLKSIVPIFDAPPKKLTPLVLNPARENLADAILLINKRSQYPVLWKIIDLTFKKYYPEKDIAIFRKLMYEVIRFSLENSYIKSKLTSLICVYFYTYNFSISSMWLSHQDVCNYFKESLLCFCGQNAPSATRVFNQFDVEEIFIKFTKMFLPVLPLIQLRRRVRLEMTWKRNETKPVKTFSSSY